MDAQLLALETYPELRRLLDLRCAGWVFKVQYAEGLLDTVRGMRLIPTSERAWGELIQIRSGTDVAAARFNPDKLPVWLFEGDMPTAIDQLMALPHPDEPTAPRLVLRSRIQPTHLWTPSGR